MNVDSMHLYIYDWMCPHPRRSGVEDPCKQSIAQWNSLYAKKRLHIRSLT